VITIRRMREEDLGPVILLDQMSFSLPWPPSAYRHELTNPGGRAWVAETTLSAPLEYHSPFPDFSPLRCEAGEKAVVGALVLWLIVDEAHIATLATHPDVRRQGIARELLRVALLGAAREGAVMSLLEVRAGNVAAQNLYLEFGFEMVGRRPRYYRDNFEDALLMTLPHLDISALER
jgi:ribosomal-protein-alanine N-acetyltransferase